MVQSDPQKGNMIIRWLLSAPYFQTQEAPRGWEVSWYWPAWGSTRISPGEGKEGKGLMERPKFSAIGSRLQLCGHGLYKKTVSCVLSVLDCYGMPRCFVVKKRYFNSITLYHGGMVMCWACWPGSKSYQVVIVEVWSRLDVTLFGLIQGQTCFKLLYLYVFVLYSYPKKDRTESIFIVSRLSWILTNSIFWGWACFLFWNQFSLSLCRRNDQLAQLLIPWHVPGKGITKRRRTDCRRWRFSAGLDHTVFHSILYLGI